jgi:glycosyl transferase family 25
MSKLDAVVYINLEHRNDRREHVENELRKLFPDGSKIHRIDAIKWESAGAYGCSKSHIKALETILEHKDWNTVLVVEDDFTFQSSDPNEVQLAVNQFLENVDPDMNVGLLSHHRTHRTFNDTSKPYIKQFFYSLTTSSYIITRKYIPTLLANFTYSATHMYLNGVLDENCLDVHWTEAMKTGKWYGIYPAIGYQYDNYSDILKKDASYKC